jgi:hypothetical protein
MRRALPVVRRRLKHFCSNPRVAFPLIFKTPLKSTAGTAHWYQYTPLDGIKFTAKLFFAKLLVPPRAIAGYYFLFRMTCALVVSGRGFQMSNLQQRIAAATNSTANLIAQLRELDLLRERVRKAELSAKRAPRPKRRNGNAARRSLESTERGSTAGRRGASKSTAATLGRTALG